MQFRFWLVLHLDIVKTDDERVWLRPKGWKKYLFGYSFESGNIFYGITENAPETNDEKYIEAINYVNHKLNCAYEYGGVWPIFKYLNMQIISSPDFWITVKNGSSKEEIKNFIKVMIEKYETDDEFLNENEI